MNVDSIPGVTGRPDAARGRALHLVALCSIAVMQPTLDGIARNEPFLREVDARWPELAGLIFVLACGVPAIAIALDRLFLYGSAFIGGRGRNTVLFGLALLGSLSLLRPILVVRTWEAQRVLWTASAATAIVAAWLFVALYQRSRLFRHWLAIGACGVVLFPAVFAARLAQRTTELAALKASVDIQNPIPVVIVVFDEFSGTTLMNDSLEIDGERFPQFARLAAGSTWYRNATTVHCRTHMAVPALLSGRFPPSERGPYLESYPHNLLSVVAQSGVYQMAVFEPLSRLCPPFQIRQRRQKTAVDRLGTLLQVSVAIYPLLILPRDTPVEFLQVPRVWHGFSEEVDFNPQTTSGVVSYDWSSQREIQLDHFLRCLQNSDRPRFCFLHAALPHFPWCFLPSGNHYLAESQAPSFPPHAVGDLGEDWINDPAAVLRSEHRYVLQAGFVDRFIGQLQDRLQAEGLWDSCLLVVTADHGVSFRPGHSRRVPDSDNLADLMCVPLFVKYPQQTSGRVDDRNVESVDVTPTVLDVLDVLETSQLEPYEGSSLLEPGQRLRKTLYFERGMTVVEPDFPQKGDAVRRHWNLFRETPIDQIPKACCSRPDWLSRRTTEFTIEEGNVPSLEIDTYQPAERTVTSQFVAALVTGSIGVWDVPASRADLVIAVDGVIVDACRLELVKFERYGFDLLLPESIASVRGSQVELFLVTENDGLVFQRVGSWLL